MIIVLKKDIKKEEIEHIVDSIHEWGLEADLSVGKEQSVIGIIGDEAVARVKPLEAFPGVDHVMQVQKPYKRASLGFKAERTRIVIPPAGPNGRELVIGGEEIIVMAGPCSVEGREMLMEIGASIKKSGARMLRGGAFKPRSSPYSFQGLGVEGIRYLREVREATGLPIVTEVMDTRDVDLIEEYSDMIQIGARNMQNFSLLKAVGRSRKPILLKRGLSSTIEELLMSAEYIMSAGNDQIVLCERGIRTFETYTRNTLDVSAVAALKNETHLPVLIDPSHGTGRRELIEPLARAGVAAGADALMIEVHNHPELALSDGPQALLPDAFESVMQGLGKVAAAIGRTLGDQ
jgi:3-deoxy-7-phosphoheptulonate synthase